MSAPDNHKQQMGSPISCNVICGIDLESYHPVEQQSHYGGINILSNGTCHSTPSLPQAISDFVLKLHNDVSVWDGTRGIYGRDYSSHRPKTEPLSEELLGSLREQYIAVKACITPSTLRQGMQKELSKFNRSLHQISDTISDMQRKIEKCNKYRNAMEIDEGQSESVDDFEEKIAFLGEELDQLKRVKSQLLAKITQKEVEIWESDTGFIHRMALLRRIFGEEPLRGGLLSKYCKDAESVVKDVYEADEKSMRTSMLLYHVKRFYVDSVMGSSHLHKVESALKAILENLQEATNLLGNGGGSAVNLLSSGQSPLMRKISTTSRREGERGPNFRIRYVKRLWNGIDADFRAALPYIAQTSMKEVYKEFVAYDQQTQLTQQSPCSLPSGKGHSIFNSANSVLPSFTKIELSHALNRRARVAALHRFAAQAYKEIAMLYDCQEKIVREALELVQRRMDEDNRANRLLVSRWEHLLGIA